MGVFFGGRYYFLETHCVERVGLLGRFLILLEVDTATNG
jgi:hypothetical protein